FDEIRLEIDDRVEEPERDVELFLFHRGLDAPHQQIAGVATGGEPERPDPVLDVFGAFLGRRDLERLEQLVDVDLGIASLRPRQRGRRLDHLGFRIRTDLGFRGRDLGLGRRVDLWPIIGSITRRRRDLRCLGTWGLGTWSLSTWSLSTWSLSSWGLSRRAHGRHGCEQSGNKESVESFGHDASLTLHQGVAKAVV